LRVLYATAPCGFRFRWGWTWISLREPADRAFSREPAELRAWAGSCSDESALDRPKFSGASRTGGTRRLRVRSRVGTWRPLVCHYLCCRQRSDNYRGETAFVLDQRNPGRTRLPTSSLEDGVSALVPL